LSRQGREKSGDGAGGDTARTTPNHLETREKRKRKGSLKAGMKNGVQKKAGS